MLLLAYGCQGRDLTRCSWAVMAKPEDPGAVSPDMRSAVPAEKLCQSG